MKKIYIYITKDLYPKYISKTPYKAVIKKTILLIKGGKT